MLLANFIWLKVDVDNSDIFHGIWDDVVSIILSDWGTQGVITTHVSFNTTTNKLNFVIDLEETFCC